MQVNTHTDLMRLVAKLSRLEALLTVVREKGYIPTHERDIANLVSSEVSTAITDKMMRFRLDLNDQYKLLLDEFSAEAHQYVGEAKSLANRLAGILAFIDKKRYVVSGNGSRTRVNLKMSEKTRDHWLNEVDALKLKRDKIPSVERSKLIPVSNYYIKDAEEWNFELPKLNIPPDIYRDFFVEQLEKGQEELETQIAEARSKLPA